MDALVIGVEVLTYSQLAVDILGFSEGERWTGPLRAWNLPVEYDRLPRFQFYDGMRSDLMRQSMEIYLTGFDPWWPSR